MRGRNLEEFQTRVSHYKEVEETGRRSIKEKITQKLRDDDKDAHLEVAGEENEGSWATGMAKISSQVTLGSRRSTHE